MQLHFAELVELPKLQRLLDRLYSLTGVASAIAEIDSTILVASGWTELCTKFHRACPATELLCRKSATDIGDNLHRGAYFGYKCLNGLNEYSCPIIVGGKHLATLLVGQIFIEAPDENFFRRRAHIFSYNEELYLEALHKIPIISEEEIADIIKVYADLASVMAELGLRRIEQTGTLNFLQQLMDAIPNPIFYKNKVGEYLGCNSAFEDFSGVDKQNIVGRSPNSIFSEEVAAIFQHTDQAVFEKNSVQNYEYQIVDAQGNNRTVFTNKAAFSNVFGEVAGVVGVIVDITERKKVEQQTQYEATHDALTGLSNRRLLEDSLSDAIEMSKTTDEFIAVIFIDLDEFKLVNDTWGHEAGDELLKEFAKRANCCIRNGDVVSRFGGDEFVIVLLGLKTKDDANTIAAQILEMCRHPFKVEQDEALISASIGISFYPHDGQDVSVLIRNADLAMYMSKQQGRNRICLTNGKTIWEADSELPPNKRRFGKNVKRNRVKNANTQKAEDCQ